MRLKCISCGSPLSCELIAVTSDNGNQRIWTGQESKAVSVMPPPTGYITIFPGPATRVAHGRTGNYISQEHIYRVFFVGDQI